MFLVEPGEGYPHSDAIVIQEAPPPRMSEVDLENGSMPSIEKVVDAHCSLPRHESNPPLCLGTGLALTSECRENDCKPILSLGLKGKVVLFPLASGSSPLLCEPPGWHAE